MPEKTTSQESENNVTTKTRYIKNEKGTLKVVEYFSGEQTYLDIIKASLRRQFGE